MCGVEECGLAWGELVVVPDGVAMSSAVRPCLVFNNKSAPLSIRSRAHSVLPVRATQSERVKNAPMSVRCVRARPAPLHLALGDRAAQWRAVSP